MIRSMTGYGQASVDLTQARVTVALRAVNHRYADVRLRLPAGLVSREAELRRKILKRVKRGRVEVAIGPAVESHGGATGTDHRQHDPADYMPRRPPSRG